ncbi:AAA family ATPase [Gracilimonas sp. Q87]|uniref:AAA family ATPase n=1 Tax=Gracilimonas sp. Q87 TaxID=3384766 RepID=UPI003984021A
MKAIQIKQLRFLGNKKIDALIEFEQGLNVIYGASDTGKSYIAETLDYMFGGSNAPRDIPEAVGYSSIELTLYVQDQGYYLLKRGYDGGDFVLFSSNENGEKLEQLETLSQKFIAGKTDSISGWLLSIIDSLHKKLKRNKKGDKKNLSFRDFARLVIVQETEIHKRTSPFLSGQFLLVTPEKSTFKYLLTGIDDSDEYLAEKDINELASVPKVELIDEWISDINIEIEQHSNKINEPVSSLEEIDKLQESLEGLLTEEKEKIENLKRTIDEELDKKRSLVQKIESRKDRIDEINELRSRFKLLSEHYSTDIQRLEAIIESGSLIVFEGSDICPLCGASEEHQNTDTDCDANFSEIVKAAEQETKKIHILAKDLGETIESLNIEEKELLDANLKSNIDLLEVTQKINTSLTAELSSTKDSYSNYISNMQDLKYLRKLIERKSNLQVQRNKFAPIEDKNEGSSEKDKRLLSETLLNEFSQMLENTLKEWHYPGSERVHFDKTEFDFVINGVPRGSRGKGFRAITHAAISCTLMEYCVTKDLPHPKFLVLDSPLLAYYKPEGDDDSLVGTDLKEKFYEYLSSHFNKDQVIIIENEAPSNDLNNINTIHFTRNENEGRYGLFPN